ncbi:extracellular solute-binding protein [Vineibacter terrae]|uniref:extracellular solute-binding protein n=1 Tax=Vineibacter terrae TaxID=2586908 RepID=UPI002E37F8AB|nr:extracellular solute-binding protein [Vineibacter terrae]HEX2885900.1 extracellular solute-binding protein [Vineibacter terrae]
MRRHLNDIEDDILEFQRATNGQRVSRRAFTAGLASLGLAPMTATLTPASARDPDLVLANWGGDSIKAMEGAYVQPFLAANPGEGVKMDSSGPTNGKIKAMVEAKRVIWDLCDRAFQSSLELGPAGLLEEVDYGIVDKSKTLPGFAGRWGVANYSFANVLTYQTKAFGGRTPTTWADFWNLKEFPGNRTLRRHIDSTLEAALLADGVPTDKLYPIDVKRAFAKVREIKDRVTFWSSHADSYKLLRDNEVTMGCLAHTRAVLLRRDTDGAVDFTFNQGVFWVSNWIVPKGNPGGKRVWKLIAATLEPAAQIEMLRRMGNGPVNPAALPLIPPDLAAINPSSPDNLKRMVVADSEWYAKNSASVLNQFIDTVLS